jgi:hypothetical protein
MTKSVSLIIFKKSIDNGYYLMNDHSRNLKVLMTLSLSISTLGIIPAAPRMPGIFVQVQNH